MNALPKPQPCGQNWLDMQPTDNGRHCGQCGKEIYDFSAMSWPEIVRTQATHGNALRGMYAPAQLAPDLRIIAFSVRKPTVFERTRWTLKRWFGKGRE
ncbi:hypothetical protein [Hymenobacter terricola]|uniref:hypothetical protein n=1 Tax=Hymenobacter terricola TaxID=2819236 RepID=UPI001B300AA5|nr:hypothetical protein [Hymenobacter terricola]